MTPLAGIAVKTDDNSYFRYVSFNALILVVYAVNLVALSKLISSLDPAVENKRIKVGANAKASVLHYAARALISFAYAAAS